MLATAAAAVALAAPFVGDAGPTPLEARAVTRVALRQTALLFDARSVRVDPRCRRFREGRACFARLVGPGLLLRVYVRGTRDSWIVSAAIR